MSNQRVFSLFTLFHLYILKEKYLNHHQKKIKQKCETLSGVMPLNFFFRETGKQFLKLNKREFEYLEFSIGIQKCFSLRLTLMNKHPICIQIILYISLILQLRQILVMKVKLCRCAIQFKHVLFLITINYQIRLPFLISKV